MAETNQPEDTAAISDETARHVVTKTQVAWVAAFGTREHDALAALYWDDALFFGSTAPLYTGREGVRQYFATLPIDIRLEDFPPPTIVKPLPDVILTAGGWRFSFAGEPRNFRLTWTLVRRNGVWRIASHHASPEDNATTGRP